MTPNYNNYPMGYQPQDFSYYQPTVTTTQPQYQYYPKSWQTQYQVGNVSQPPPAQQQNNNAMVWVQGEAGAKAYVLPNGTTLPLWDSEAPVVYIKSVDSSGKPSMTILDYVDRNAPPEQELQDIQYVTLEQFNTLNDQVGSLSGLVSEIEKKMSERQKGQQPQQQNVKRGNNK